MYRSAMVCLFLVLTGFLPASRVAAQPNLVLIALEQTGPAWSDSRLLDKLTEQLTRDGRVRVSPMPPCDPSKAVSRAASLDLDRLISEGRARQGQYVLYIRVASERYERRKTFSVPLIFHKWEVIGVIEGEWRLVDPIHGKLIKAEPFHLELNGKRVIQATMDDNVDDPDINMNPTDKMTFFGQLEDLLAQHLLGSIAGQIGKQDREYVSRPIEKK
ncbi:MAG: hypothetical protein WAU88_04470 [Candidatus Zixiibacteriota bacterium]